MTVPPGGRGPRRTYGEDEPPVGEDRPTTVSATVTEALPNAMYAVKLTDGTKVLVRVSGDLKTRGMRVNPGDRVTVELSAYDPSRGRITVRER